jgi:hypothetical protein
MPLKACLTLILAAIVRITQLCSQQLRLHTTLLIENTIPLIKHAAAAAGVHRTYMILISTWHGLAHAAYIDTHAQLLALSGLT